ncbi:MAG: 4Fe-4S binding protein [Granulosicoccaceae bacterium]
MNEGFDFPEEGAGSLPASAQVVYESKGRCLIVAEADYGLELASRLPDLQCTVLVLDSSRESPELLLTEDGERVVVAQLASMSGYLGRFDVLLQDGGGQISAVKAAQLGEGYFDVVFDAGGKPLVEHTTVPLGYFAPRDESSLEAALLEANEMTGEFEKPIFSLYDQSKCAHGASQKRGCDACINACSAGAIRSIGNSIELDNMLCMGCGSCTTVCPTGALRFAFPDAVTSLNQLRDILQMSEGALRTVVFYPAESGEAYLQAQRDSIPDSCLPVAVEEVSSIGMDIWLSLLAFGAGNVVLLCADSDSSDGQLLAEQMSYAHALLHGLGIDAKAIDLMGMAQGADIAKLEAVPAWVSEPATYALFDDKRQLIRRAMDRLASRAVQTVPELAELPIGAPFGAIVVAGDKCTLCMACTSACPTSALMSMGGDAPGLKFVEEACVQCGLCRNTCPEDALSRLPRYLYDSNAAREPVVLYREEPYRCLRCAKPFATRSGIETITAKLANHPMFQEPAALNRLKMCEDCRVVDMMESDSPTLNS